MFKNEKKEISIMFGNFGMEPELLLLDLDDLARFMNAYYMAAAKCIYDQEGTLVRFIGDAAFAIWNSPNEIPGHPKRACLAALAWTQLKFKGPTGRLLGLPGSVGLNTGVAFIGNVGTSTRVHYEAVGHTVNVARRLESANKKLGTKILATRQTQTLMKDDFVWRFLGSFQFEEFSGLVEVCELLDFPERAEESAGWLQEFSTALNHFQHRNFDVATIGFENVLRLRENAESGGKTNGDAVSSLYLKRIQEFRRTSASELAWRNHVVMDGVRPRCPLWYPITKESRAMAVSCNELYLG